jgi:hypothetical protein
MTERTIAACKIGPYPKSFFDLDMPKVAVTYNDGKEETLFTFYPDELSFSESEFVGLTREQAFTLRHRKDVSYLRS